MLLATTNSLTEYSKSLPQLVDQMQAAFTMQTQNINVALCSLQSAKMQGSESVMLTPPVQAMDSLKHDILVATSEMHTLRLALSGLKVLNLLQRYSHLKLHVTITLPL